MLKANNFRWRSVVALCVVGVLVFLLIGPLWFAARANATSVLVLHKSGDLATPQAQPTTAQSEAANIETTIKDGQCVQYLQLLTSARGLAQQNPAQTYLLTEKAQLCQGAQRHTLLIPLESYLLTAQGRHSESCQVLSSINAKSMILDQVEQAYQRQDWEAQAFYLECLQNLEIKPGYISPWLVSDQYARLGHHYELTGQLDKSLAAYTRSADLYPGVYANPITGKARVLRQQGNLTGAIDALIDGLKRPGGDNVNNFVLLSDLAYLWELNGKPSNAYCTYEGALKLLPSIPAGMDPQHLRANLEAGVRRLPSEAFQNYRDCGKLVAIPLPPDK